MPARQNTSMSVAFGFPARPFLTGALREEADFANDDYRRHAGELEINPAMFRRYTSPVDMWDWRQRAARLLRDVSRKELLDFGCGMGEESIYFAKLGARVTAIDISEVGIASLRRRSNYHQLDIRAFEMRADPTAFAASTFDRIHGLGILHHIGVDDGLREVWRLLRPGGVGVFLEPMGDCRVVETAKAWLMAHGRFMADFDRVTNHEHNLTWGDVERATRIFSSVELHPYHLLYRLKRFLPQRTLDSVRRVDARLLSLVPALRRYAGAVVIVVGKAARS